MIDKQKVSKKEGLLSRLYDRILSWIGRLYGFDKPWIELNNRGKTKRLVFNGDKKKK